MDFTILLTQIDHNIKYTKFSKYFTAIFSFVMTFFKRNSFASPCIAVLQAYTVENLYLRVAIRVACPTVASEIVVRYFFHVFRLLFYATIELLVGIIPIVTKDQIDLRSFIPCFWIKTNNPATEKHT